MRGAGGGRPAKDPDQRRNRNKPTRTEIVVPADAKVLDPPEPAFPLDGIRLEIWRRMWDQPIAILWDPVDVAALTRLVLLQTDLKALGNRGVLAEMRQLEDRFLLNPYARAQQRVTIEDRGNGSDPTDNGEVAELARYRNRMKGR